jgi:hypothetical protein
MFVYLFVNVRVFSTTWLPLGEKRRNHVDNNVRHRINGRTEGGDELARCGLTAMSYAGISSCNFSLVAVDPMMISHVTVLGRRQE